MVNIRQPDSSFTLGTKLSQAQFAIDEANKVRPGSEQKSRVIGVMNASLLHLRSFAKTQENFWERLFRVVLNFFGIVTQYQKVLNQITSMERKANRITTSETELQKEKLQKIKEENKKKIGVFAGVLHSNLDEIEVGISNIKSQAQKIKSIGEEHNQVESLLALYKRNLKKIEEPLSKITEIYQDDIPQFKEIPKLWNRYTVAKKTLSKISSQLTEQVFPSQTNGKVKKKNDALMFAPGGIINAGNTCYLASTMQTMNALPQYRELFDPNKNPLIKRLKESSDIYKQRQEIQRIGFEILETIKSGENVKKDEIDGLRKACHSYKINKKGLIANLSGPLDSVETLVRLLSVLDYKEKKLTFNFQDTVQNEENYEEINDGKYRNPNNFSTLAEAQNYSTSGNLYLCAYLHVNQTVPMQTLLNDFWKPEPLTENIYKHISEDGAISYRKYKQITRNKTLDINSIEFPKELHVTVQQLNENRVTIKDAEFIYPSGKENVGPRYRLAAIIEHMPGHYVAHVVTENGMITANDSWVHASYTSNIPGYGYFYIRDDNI